MIRKRKLLLLSRCFPPLLSVGGKRAYHFARYLRECGWEPIVVTSPLPKRAPIDHSFSDLDVIRTYSYLSPRFWPRPDISYINDLEPIKTRQNAISKWGKLKLPLGHDVAAFPYAFPKLLQLCKSERVSMVLATGGPASTLVLGACIARFTRLPLCLDFRDPWTLNYLQNEKNQGTRQFERMAEKSLCQQANLIVFSSKSCRDAYAALYPSLTEKMISVYTGFDSSCRPPSRPPFKSFTLVHFGNCHGARDLSTVLWALYFVRREIDFPRGSIKLLNLGRIQDKDVELATQLDLMDALEFCPPIDYHNGISLLRAADMLVLLGYGIEKSFIPAKTFDYLLARRPVLCVTACPELSGIVNDAKAGWVVAPGDSHAASLAIKFAIENRNVDKCVSIHTEQLLESYEASANVAILARYLDSVMLGQEGCLS